MCPQSCRFAEPRQMITSPVRKPADCIFPTLTREFSLLLSRLWRENEELVCRVKVACYSSMQGHLSLHRAHVGTKQSDLDWTRLDWTGLDWTEGCAATKRNPNNLLRGKAPVRDSSECRPVAVLLFMDGKQQMHSKGLATRGLNSLSLIVFSKRNYGILWYR